MEKLTTCRLCLAENVRMHIVANRNLHELYEKLTDIPFVTKDTRPILACFFCCTKLKQCYQLLRQCLKAEEMYAQMMNKGYKPNSLNNQNHLEVFSGLMKSPIQHISIVDEFQTESIAIKDELPAVCEGLDDIIEPKLEHQSDELELKNFDSSGLNVADIPPHHSESDVEGDVTLMKFKTEVKEEQAVSQKKQRATETNIFKMAKTNAECCKNYYNRKKAAKEAEKIRQGLSVKKPIKKTGAERNRAYRLRKKMLSQVNESSVTEMSSIPSTSNSRISTFEPSFQLATTSASTNRSIANAIPLLDTVEISGK